MSKSSQYSSEESSERSTIFNIFTGRASASRAVDSNVDTGRRAEAGTKRSGFGADLEATAERFPLISREETYKQFFDICNKDVSLKQSIVWISIVQVFMYILCLTYSKYYQLPWFNTLHLFGGTYGPSIRSGQIWRFITPIFIHGNILHLVFNVTCIFYIGLAVEQTFGTLRFLIIYFGGGLMGTMMSVMVHPCAVSIGSSTSGFAILATVLCQIHLLWDTFTEEERQKFQISFFFLFGMVLILFFVPTVDNFGHLGGFLFGSACALSFIRDEASPPWAFKALVAAVVLCLLIAIGCIFVVWFLPLHCTL